MRENGKMKRKYITEGERKKAKIKQKKINGSHTTCCNNIVSFSQRQFKSAMKKQKNHDIIGLKFMAFEAKTIVELKYLKKKNH